MYVYYVWEGQLKEGLPSGFARYINPTHSFIGYLDNLGYTKQGTGLYFKGPELQTSAFFPEGLRYRRKEPEEASKKAFTAFSEVA